MIAGELRQPILLDSGLGQLVGSYAVGENVIHALAGILRGEASDFAGGGSVKRLKGIDISRIQKLLNRRSGQFSAVGGDVFARAQAYICQDRSPGPASLR